MVWKLLLWLRLLNARKPNFGVYWNPQKHNIYYSMFFYQHIKYLVSCYVLFNKYLQSIQKRNGQKNMVNCLKYYYSNVSLIVNSCCLVVNVIVVRFEIIIIYLSEIVFFKMIFHNILPPHQKFVPSTALRKLLLYIANKYAVFNI